MLGPEEKPKCQCWEALGNLEMGMGKEEEHLLGMCKALVSNLFPEEKEK